MKSFRARLGTRVLLALPGMPLLQRSPSTPLRRFRPFKPCKLTSTRKETPLWTARWPDLFPPRQGLWQALPTRRPTLPTTPRSKRVNTRSQRRSVLTCLHLLHPILSLSHLGAGQLVPRPNGRSQCPQPFL